MFPAQELPDSRARLRFMRSPSSQSHAALASRLLPLAAGTASDSGAELSSAANATPPATLSACIKWYKMAVRCTPHNLKC